MSEKQKCGALTKADRPCRAWAVRDSNPARCAAHANSQQGTGSLCAGDAAAVTIDGPSGTTGAIADSGQGTRSFYAEDAAAITIDQAIADLVDKLTRLDQLIDQTAETSVLIRLLTVHTQAISRLDRLLSSRQALSEEAGGDLPRAIHAALDELGAEWGIDL